MIYINKYLYKMPKTDGGLLYIGSYSDGSNYTEHFVPNGDDKVIIIRLKYGDKGLKGCKGNKGF